MTTSLTLKLATASSILALSIWLVFFPVKFEILQPRLGQPYILQPGDLFLVKIKTSVPYWSQKWEASLLSVTETIKLDILNIQTDFAYQTLRIKLPNNIRDNKYTLTLKSHEQQHYREGAIHIIAHPSNNISIIQMADLPTLSSSGQSKGDQQLNKIIQETNLINPQLVLFTGDLAYQGSWAQYYQLLDAMKSINAPLIAAPGNHEYQGWSAFLTLLGQPYHCVEYGKYIIISLNSGHSRDQLTYSQLSWLEKKLENNKLKNIIIQLHHPIHHRKNDRGYLKNNVEQLLNLIKKHKVKIVLSGHWHGDALFDDKGQLRNDTWKFSGTPFVVTTAAGAKLRKNYSQSPLHHGYRLVRFSQGEIDNFTYDYNGDNQRDASSSIPYNNLSINRPDLYTAIITNDLNESFKNILIEFKPPENAINYKVSNGQIINQFIKNKQLIVQVTSEIKKQSRIKIQLQMENN